MKTSKYIIIYLKLKIRSCIKMVLDINKAAKHIRNNDFINFSNDLFFIENDQFTDEYILSLLNIENIDQKFILLLIDKYKLINRIMCKELILIFMTKIKNIKAILFLFIFSVNFDKDIINYIIENKSNEIIIKTFKTCNIKILNKCFHKLFNLKNKENIINEIIDNKLININYIDKFGNSYLYYLIEKYKNIALKLIDIMLVDFSIKNLRGETLLSKFNDQEIIDKLLNIYFDKQSNKIIKKYKKDNIFYYNDIKVEKGSFGTVFPISNRENIKIAKKIKLLDSFYDCSIITELFIISRINKTYQYPMSSIIDGYMISNNSFYIIMEPFDLTLRKYFNIIDGKIDKVDIIIESCFKSLYQLHCLGIMHQDIKPNNIMVSNNKVYLIDYGISQIFGISPISHIVSNYNTTDNVCPPEAKTSNLIFINKQGKIIHNVNMYKILSNISYHCDIFSLGVTLLQCLFNTFHNYIYYDEKLYYNDFNHNKYYDGWKCDQKIFIEIDIIENESKYFKQILKMVSLNFDERPILKDILDYKYNNFLIDNNQICDYIFKQFNEVHELFVINLKYYTYDSIIKKKDELVYLEEIHYSYKNDIFKINNNGNNNEYYLKINKLLMYFIQTKNNYKNIFSFDALINTFCICSTINKNFLPLCYSFFINIGSSSKILINETESMITKYNNFVIDCIEKNITLNPVMLHIQYYLIKMRYFITSDELLHLEWFLIKNIFLLFILETFDITIDDLCQILLFKYYKNSNLLIKLKDNKILSHDIIDKHFILYIKIKNIKDRDNLFENCNYIKKIFE